jgi:hypothetical protein
MSRMGFEPTTPMSEQAKTVHAIDRTAIAMGLLCASRLEYFCVTVYF